MKTRILVNAISAKKHSGGGFQIAYNFVKETLHYDEVEWYYLASSDIDEQIGAEFKELRDKRYFVFPTQPDFLHSYWRVRKEVSKLEQMIKPDLVYSVLAPSYFCFKSLEVMRYANPWVTHPNKFSISRLSLKQRIRTFFYCALQRYLMRKSQFFETETETAKLGILRVTGLPDSHVKVIGNVLPAVYVGMDTTPFPHDEWINVACVGVPVPHKNIDIIPQLLIELKKLNINNVRFHTTIPQASPMIEKVVERVKLLGLGDNLVNHGRISQQELGIMYRHCQFCFLPTLLEVFSASTVEAMYFQLPVVATHFDFNTEVMGDSCLYYAPQNAADAARQFAKLINDPQLCQELKQRMQQRLLQYSDYDAHFKEVATFLEGVAKGK